MPQTNLAGSTSQPLHMSYQARSMDALLTSEK
jgi:hypothetical protein